MNPKTQYHIGTFLKALGDLGQHLIGADPETVAPAPAITGEPTDQQPPKKPRGRPAGSMSAPGPAATPAPAADSLDIKVAPEVTVIPVTKPPEDDFGATPEPEKEKVPTGPFESYEEARKFIDPMTKDARGAEVVKVIAGLLPEGKVGLRALIEFPEKHAEFIKQILALKK